MMWHRQVEQAALFYEFSLERHIPADHLLRSIDRFERPSRDPAGPKDLLTCRSSPLPQKMKPYNPTKPARDYAFPAPLCGGTTFSP